MDDDRAVVDQLPPRGPLAFDEERTHALGAQRLQQGVRQGLALALAVGGGDDEVVCQRGDTVDVEEQDVFSLLVVEQIDDGVSQFGCVQKYYLSMKNPDRSQTILAQGVRKATNRCRTVPTWLMRKE